MTSPAGASGPAGRAVPAGEPLEPVAAARGGGSARGGGAAAALPPGPHSPQRIFALAAAGSWDAVRALLLGGGGCPPALPGQCARYRDAASGRTLLHVAAAAGHAKAAGMCVRMGAALDAPDAQGRRPIDVAVECEFLELGAQLGRWREVGGLWRPVADPLLWASSNQWGDRQPRRAATRALSVAYAGGVVDIPVGGHYWPDSAGRPLVGGNGSYDPPGDMDGESMVDV